MGCVATKDVEQRQFHDQYMLQKKLGKGAFAQVRLAVHVSTQQEFAVKILDLRENKSLDKQKRPSPERLMQELRAEQKAWRHVGDHVNCIRLYDAFIDESFGYFVMEKCSSPLLEGFRAEADLNEHAYVKYFKGMLAGLAHVHARGVVHRDVKQDNFLLGGPNHNTVKLCDFGLSVIMPADHKLTGVFGTAPYMSPEMISRKAHGEKTDVWSFGVVVYSAFFGTFPYNPKEKNSEAMKQVIRDGTPAPLFSTPKKTRFDPVSPPALEFVTALLNRDVAQRPSATQALDMTYIKESEALLTMANRDIHPPVSLAPMLLWAVRAGAFGTRPPQADPVVDDALEALQEKHCRASQNPKQPRSHFASCEPTSPNSRTSRPSRSANHEMDHTQSDETTTSRRRLDNPTRKTNSGNTKMAWESDSTKAASSDRDDQHSNSSVQLSFFPADSPGAAVVSNRQGLSVAPWQVSTPSAPRSTPTTARRH
eukprot:TRINITY_DN16749_c0_g1_i1.p1 TRINITY_DN16749_c0_g1~~TRINITY_DN16749_c0_g1_i1.p1  ORF type:complete len:480 (-),score=64.00 TRINITY_DN16749_c0_g1_i1:44-1483(-)